MLILGHFLIIGDHGNVVEGRPAVDEAGVSVEERRAVGAGRRLRGRAVHVKVRANRQRAEDLVKQGRSGVKIALIK